MNSCLEAKKEAVNRAIAESTAKMAKEGRAKNKLHSVEGPPALEPAPSGEQILNNTDRSPPKLEAPAGLPVPSILRQNLTSSTKGAKPPATKNGKPGRRKMSKKEIDLPPSVVKFKAEQALLELSITKFRKIRSKFLQLRITTGEKLIRRKATSNFIFSSVDMYERCFQNGIFLLVRISNYTDASESTFSARTNENFQWQPVAFN